jgi:hypothetical protein
VIYAEWSIYTLAKLKLAFAAGNKHYSTWSMFTAKNKSQATHADEGCANPNDSPNDSDETLQVNSFPNPSIAFISFK